MDNDKLIKIDDNNNNTENAKEDILTTFNRIVASAQFIRGISNFNKQQTQQQNQINYLENIKGEEMQKNNNFNFKQFKYLVSNDHSIALKNMNMKKLSAPDL
uniref:Uncharacterized protein n=1 Tax=Meloidogyne hapla TaxID=6305 RepID=A0A1I8BUH7_MELHA